MTDCFRLLIQADSRSSLQKQVFLEIFTFMPNNNPGEVEHHTWFSKHVGPRFQTAGLRVQFHYNEAPGVHFQVEPPKEYEAAIIQGIEDGLTELPELPANW